MEYVNCLCHAVQAVYYNKGISKYLSMLCIIYNRINTKKIKQTPYMHYVFYGTRRNIRGTGTP
jgi:hypothetical protein